MFELIPEFTIEYVLNRISQEEIFERYVGIDKISMRGMYCSPLRDDKSPTCSFRYIGKKLIFKDWSGHFSGDCFDLVKHKYSCSLYEAIKIIMSDFGLIKHSIGLVRPEIKNKQVTSKQQNKELKVTWGKYKQKDFEYWNKQGISKETLYYYKVCPVQNIWVDDKLIYSYNDKDVGYGYWFDTGKMKIYFPKRESSRFLGNTNVLQGYNQLPEKGDILIITKSLKDVMFFYECGIAAIAPQTESTILTKKQFKELKKRFTKIYINYDFDYAGVKSINKARKLYSVIPLIFTNGRFKTKKYEGKDITDICKNTNKQYAINIIKKLLNYENS